MAHRVYFNGPNDKGQCFSIEDIQEQKLKDCFDATILVSYWQITEDNKKKFSNYIKDEMPKQIVFFNRLSPNTIISETFLQKVLLTSDKRVLVLNKQRDGIKTSADFVALVY